MATPQIFLLSTQTLSAGVIEAAALAGVRLDAMPFIRTEPLHVTEVPDSAITALFTSQHAVAALPHAGGKWKIFCIDGATRRAVEDRFGAGLIAGTASSAAGLARVILDSEPQERSAVGSGKKLVFFCGDLRREELPELLRQAGYTVEERIVYRTLLTPHRVEQEYAGIAFFSPSAAESFFSMNTVKDTTEFFAIGRTTAAAVRRLSGRDAIVAGKPDKEVLIHEMITHFTI